jgi:hypothetical protein
LEYCFLEYAEHLITLDKFKEAQEAYKKAGRTDLSIKLLEKLKEKHLVFNLLHKRVCFSTSSLIILIEHFINKS